MAEHFNQLTPKEAELLALLAEECGEVIQVIGKILRHGLQSYHPDDPEQRPNRDLLEVEIGHVSATSSMLIQAGVLNEDHILRSRRQKFFTVERWLHHQQDQS
jgi:hypothetical protein